MVNRDSDSTSRTYADPYSYGGPGYPTTGKAPYFETTEKAVAPAANLPAVVPGKATLKPGQQVAIRMGEGALVGQFLGSNPDGSVTVQPQGRAACQVAGEDVVRLFAAHEKVLYSNPADRLSRAATVVRAQGNIWPPFYSISFANQQGTVETEQAYLKPLYQ